MNSNPSTDRRHQPIDADAPDRIPTATEQPGTAAATEYHADQRTAPPETGMDTERRADPTTAEGERDAQATTADSGGRTELTSTASNAAADDGLDEEQQQAFEAIMAEIEADSRAEAAPIEAGETAGGGAADAPVDASAAPAAAEAPSASEDSVAPSSSDGLDEAPHQALEAIMAEIEAGNRADAAPVEAGDAADAGAADLPVDVPGAPAAADAPSTSEDSVTPSSDDGLDEAQQQALEAIMAEIKADGDADDHDGSPVERTTARESDAPDRAADECDTADDDRPTADAWSEELDEDQQRAFASIMAQLQGQDADAADPSAEPVDAPPSPDSPTESGAAAPDEPGGTSDDPSSAGDGADEIEQILDNIAVEREASALPPIPQETAGPEAGDCAGTDIIAAAGAGSPKETEGKGSPSAENGSGSATSSDPDRPTNSVAGTASDHRLPSAGPVAQRPGAAGRARKRSRRVLALAGTVAVMAGAAYMYAAHRTVDPMTPAAVATEAPPVATTDDAGDPAGGRPDTTLALDDRLSDEERLKTVVAALDELRGQLIDKQTTTEELGEYYRVGIDAEMQTIATALNRAGGAPPTLDQALADSRIALGLAAIQRRDTYIRKLTGPLKLLHHASEEVLFWSRKADAMQLMATKTSDIDIDGYVNAAQRVVARHQRSVAELNIDSFPAAPLEMEVLWRRVIAHLPKAGTAAVGRSDRPVGDDSAIARRICSGDYADKHLLTTLSPDAARCLSQWEGKDLFLNGLTDLQPEAARYLAQWAGDWLGLNGLTTLSPEAAAQLVRWKGKGLSLNGLTRLSPRIVAILSEWQGEQIELINVQHMAHWENPHVRLLLSENLKRRRQIARN